MYDKKATLIDYTKLTGKAYSEVTDDEINLLSILYKNVVTYSNIAIKYYSKELMLKFFKLII